MKNKNTLKKILYILFSTVIILGGFFKVHKTFASEIENPENYIEIRNLEDLQNIKNNLSGNYILLNDLDLKELNFWEPIGSSTNPFTGIFDGKNNSIKNLNVSGEVLEFAIFGEVLNGTIKNLAIENLNSNLKVDSLSSQNIGGLAGRINNTLIQNCYVTGNLKILNENHNKNLYIGGIVGYSYKSKIEDSHFQGNISTSEYIISTVGGITAYGNATDITRCSSTNGTLEGYIVGGISGGLKGASATKIATLKDSYSNINITSFYLNVNTTPSEGQNFTLTSTYNSKIINCYYTGFSNTKYIYETNESQLKNIENSYYDSNINPLPNQEKYGKTSEELKQENTFLNWDFINTWEIKEGKSYPELKSKIILENIDLENPELNYVEIKTVEDLKNVNNNLSANYILMNDLDLSELNYWEPIGNSENNFMGVFDGNGFSLKNLNITQNHDNFGIFGFVTGGEIKNLTLENFKLNITLDFGDGGVLVNYIDSGKIKDCYISGEFNFFTTRINTGIFGGVAGISVNSKIEDTHFTGNLFVPKYISYRGGYITGGIVGRLVSGEISRVSVVDSIVGGNSSVGALVGNISDEYIKGSIIKDSYSNASFQYGTYNTPVNYVLAPITKNTKLINCYYSGEALSKSIFSLPDSIKNLEENIISCYFDIDLNPSYLEEKYGKTTEELNQESTFLNWDFINTWEIKEGNSYPTLRKKSEIINPPNESLNFIFTMEKNKEIKLVSEFTNVTWISEDENVATVTNGVIKTLNQGTTKITMIDLETNQEDFIYIKVKED